MTNSVYPKFLKRCLTSGGNLVAGTVKCSLIDTSLYTRSDADEFYSAVAAAVVGTPVTLAGCTVSDLGAFDSATNPSFTGLVSAPSIEALVVWVDTGSAATSPLVAFIDSAIGLPVPAGKTQVDITWDDGPNKVFKL